MALKLPLTALSIVICSLSTSVFAQVKGEYDIKKYNAHSIGFGEGCYWDIKANISFRTLFGEPVVDGKFVYTSIQDCELPYDTELWIPIDHRLQDRAGWVKISPTVGNPGEWGFNTPGSPNWNKLIHKKIHGDEYFSASEAENAWRSASDYTVNEKAIKLVQRRCEINHFQSDCDNRESIQPTKDAKRTTKQSDDDSCNENISKDCYNTGKAAYDLKENNLALSSFQKSCDSGDMQGCYWLGWLYEDGRGVSVDYKKAYDLYKEAGNGGFAKGFNAIGNLYTQGRGVPHDNKRASVFYTKSCDKGEGWGCFNLAELYEKGFGVSRDYNRARALYKKACDGGVKKSCNN